MLPSKTPFISRQRELALLERALASAMQGQPAIVLLSGEAGIGKTRLLAEFRHSVTRRGARWGYGCAQRGVSPPYLPVADALLPLLEGREQARLLRAGFRGPQSAEMLPIENVGARSQFFFETTRALLELGRRRPSVLVVDDLQWADAPSLELLTYMAFAIAGAEGESGTSILLIGAYRPPEPGSALEGTTSRLQREHSCERIEIDPLDEFDTRMMLGHLGLEPPSNQLVHTMWNVSRGNPLFIEEIARHLERSGELTEQAGFVTTTTAPEDLVLPSDVSAAVSGRTARLSKDCRKALARAAVLGERFTLDALTGLLDAPQEAVLDWLEEALGEHLIDEVGDAFEFAHVTIQQVLYRSLPGFRREKLHLRAADELTQSRPDATAEIAHHLVRARSRADPIRVAAQTRLAAERALAAADWGAAAQLFEHAIAALEKRPGSSQQDLAELHFQTGLAFNRNMDPGPCIRRYQLAAVASRAAGDAAGYARALMEELRAEVTYGRVSSSNPPDLDRLTEALDALAPEDAWLRGLGLDILASAYWATRRPHQAFELASEALEIGERIGDDHLCAEVASSIALAHLDRLELSEALVALQSGLEHAQRIEDWTTAGLCLQRIPMVLLNLGRLDEAESTIAQSRELNERVRNWGDFSLVTASDAALSAIRGDFEGVEERSRETLRMIARSRYPWAGPGALSTLSCARTTQGSPAEAHDALDLLIEPGLVFDDPSHVAVIQQQLSPMIDAFDRQSEQAPPHDPEEERPIDPKRLDLWHTTRACVQVELAWRYDLRTLVEGSHAALELASARGVVFTSGWIFLLPRIIGLANAVEGHLKAASEQLERAAVLAEELGAKVELARTLLDHAELLERYETGDASHAAELRRRGQALCEELGMWAFIDRPTDRDPSELLPGEAQVLEQIARGRSGSEAASELLLSPESVARRTEQVFAKLDVEGPTGAAAAALAMSDRIATPLPAHLPKAPTATPLTFLVSDIRGSTEMLAQIGDEAGRDLLRIHNQIIRRCLIEYAGDEIQHTGDGFLTYFRRADDAIECAAELQHRFADYNHSEGSQELQIRIGLHTGVAIPDEGRFIGIAVNTAARVCSQARAGEVLVSPAVRDAATRNFEFVSRGARELKGIEEPIELLATFWQGEAT